MTKLISQKKALLIKVFVLFIVVVLCQYGCTSFKYSEGGRVESTYRNFYFNDSLHVGAVVYGDMDLEVGDQTRSLAIKMTPFCKKVLRRFGLIKSQPLLFTSMSKKYSVVGLIRNADDVKLNEYKNVMDNKVFYLRKSIVYRGVEATEGLIRLDNTRFLSIIDYGESERENAKEGFHTVMINSVRRIRSGESMVPVLNPFSDAEDLFENHGYLAPYLLAASRNKYKEKNLLDQALATYYSFSGSQDSVSKAEKSFIGFNNVTISAKKLIPAADEILNQTLDKEVVMFNTAHHRPEHAYFVGQLLHRLRDQGFTHLALEALADSSNVMKRGFATLDDGFYVRDPVMTNLINHAIALGFQVIGYESSSVDREHGQAKNLADQTLKLKKGCRLIVLAGYAHIDETMRPKRMAAYFHEITGINPFTIDQTKLMTSVCNDLEADNRQDVFIYTNKDSTTGTDLQIWNNLNLLDKPVGFNRNQIPRETNIGLPDSLEVTDSLIAISVFNQADYLTNLNASPIYVTVQPFKGGTHKINLHPGTYLIQYSGKNRDLIYSKKLVISD